MLTDAEKKNLWDVGNELATSFTENGGLPWSPEWAQWVQVEVDAYAAPGREAEVRAALLEGGEDAFCGFLAKRKRRWLLDTPEGREWVERVEAWKRRYAAEWNVKVEEVF